MKKLAKYWVTSTASAVWDALTLHSKVDFSGWNCDPKNGYSFASTVAIYVEFTPFVIEVMSKKSLSLGFSS